MQITERYFKNSITEFIDPDEYQELAKKGKWRLMLNKIIVEMFMAGYTLDAQTGDMLRGVYNFVKKDKKGRAPWIVNAD